MGYINIYGQEEEQAPEEFKPVWGFINCHTAGKQGARAWNMMTEYNYGYSMLQLTSQIFVTRNNDGVQGAGRVLRFNEVNASIECHFNAFNGKAEGAMLLVMEGDKLSEKYAREIIEQFKKYFPDRKLRADNGVSIIKKADRGFNNLQTAKDCGMEIAIMSELMFGDNEADWISISKQAGFWDYCIGEMK